MSSPLAKFPVLGFFQCRRSLSSLKSPEHSLQVPSAGTKYKFGGSEVRDKNMEVNCAYMNCVHTVRIGMYCLLMKYDSSLLTRRLAITSTFHLSSHLSQAIGSVSLSNSNST